MLPPRPRRPGATPRSRRKSPTRSRPSSATKARSRPAAIRSIPNTPTNRAPTRKPIDHRLSAQNTITVETGALDLVGPLIDAAIAAGANRVNSLDFNLRDNTKARNEAIAKAAKDAQAQAQALASRARCQARTDYQRHHRIQRGPRPVMSARLRRWPRTPPRRSSRARSRCPRPFRSPTGLSSVAALSLITTDSCRPDQDNVEAR